MSTLGIFTSSIIGVVIIIQLIKYVLSVFIRACQIRQEYGNSWHIVISLWGSLTHVVFHRKMYMASPASADTTRAPPAPPLTLTRRT